MGQVEYEIELLLGDASLDAGVDDSVVDTLYQLCALELREVSQRGIVVQGKCVACEMTEIWVSNRGDGLQDGHELCTREPGHLPRVLAMRERNHIPIGDAARRRTSRIRFASGRLPMA